MYETSVVIVGNIVNDPVHRRVGEQSVVKFRVASNSRRKTAEGAWETGDTLFASVSCWGALVAGTAGSLTKGDPVIVVGDIYTSEYDDRDGNPRNSVEVRAHAVGPNLARSRATIERIQRRPDEPAPESADDETATDESEPTESDLPLTA